LDEDYATHLEDATTVTESSATAAGDSIETMTVAECTRYCDKRVNCLNAVASCSHFTDHENKTDIKPCTLPISLSAADAYSASAGTSMEDDLEKAECRRADILLVAPTGKAAHILGRRTGLTAYTLHQVIYAYDAWRRNGKQDAFRFSDVRALVVDESSLVAVTTFSKLVAALTKSVKTSSLRKVVILGDIHQLPSIEPGLHNF